MAIPESVEDRLEELQMSLLSDKKAAGRKKNLFAPADVDERQSARKIHCLLKGYGQAGLPQHSCE